MKEIEIPFGAKDSELKGWEYTIPEGMDAEIKDGKIVVREKKPELTEFEEMLYSIFDAYNGLKIDVRAAIDVNAKTLLELAKNEICKGCTVGLDQYWKGREDARKEYENAQRLQKEQKPAEWSEEDKETIRDAINRIEQLDHYWNRPRDEKLIKRLKSLRPSWKPSEDEERLINTSISFLKDFADKGYENAVECIDWLKSKLNGNSCK